MAKIHVNPTRMELNRLKKQLVVARRGHKLLKDKRDELMRKFLEIVKENKRLRERVEELLTDAYRQFVIARAVIPPHVLKEGLMHGKKPIRADIDTKNIMGVEVPVFTVFPEYSSQSDTVPYGMASVTGELDMAVNSFNEALPLMLKLAQTEKTAQLLADEIEKTRRRVNSLEHVLIPEYEETIKSISMKLDESERGNLTRLMKVKDMIVKQAIEQARAKDPSR